MRHGGRGGAHAALAVEWIVLEVLVVNCSLLEPLHNLHCLVARQLGGGSEGEI